MILLCKSVFSEVWASKKTGVLKQLRVRKQYIKKSVLRRQEIIKAEYVERMHSEE